MQHTFKGIIVLMSFDEYCPLVLLWIILSEGNLWDSVSTGILSNIISEDSLWANVLFVLKRIRQHMFSLAANWQILVESLVFLIDRAQHLEMANLSARKEHTKDENL